MNHFFEDNSFSTKIVEANGKHKNNECEEELDNIINTNTILREEKDRLIKQTRPYEKKRR